jgi:hypothetical protein
MTKQENQKLREEYEAVVTPKIPQGQAAVNQAEWEWFVSKLEEKEDQIKELKKQLRIERFHVKALLK